MKKILIVIDMQNDFVTGALGSEAAQTATKNIADHIKDYDMVVFNGNKRNKRRVGGTI